MKEMELLGLSGTEYGIEEIEDEDSDLEDDVEEDDKDDEEDDYNEVANCSFFLSFFMHRGKGLGMVEAWQLSYSMFKLLKPFNELSINVFLSSCPYADTVLPT